MVPMAVLALTVGSRCAVAPGLRASVRSVLLNTGSARTRAAGEVVVAIGYLQDLAETREAGPAVAPATTKDPHHKTALLVTPCHYRPRAAPASHLHSRTSSLPILRDPRSRRMDRAPGCRALSSGS